MKTTTIPAQPASAAPAAPSFDLDQINRALSHAQSEIALRQQWLHGQLLALRLVLDAMLAGTPPSNLKHAHGILDATGHAVDCMDGDLDQLANVRSLLSDLRTGG